MHTLGIHDGSGSTVAAALAEIFKTAPPVMAGRGLVLLPFGAGDAATERALLRLNGRDPDETLLGCVWVVRTDERLDASFALDGESRQLENHARFLTSSGWQDCLLVASGDPSRASVAHARRSHWIMSRSSNELRAGTNTDRVLDRVDECPGARVFLLSEALDGSGVWHGLDALIAFLDDRAVTRRHAPKPEVELSRDKLSHSPRWMAYILGAGAAGGVLAMMLLFARLLGWLG